MGSYAQMNSYEEYPYRCPNKVHLSWKVEGFFHNLCIVMKNTSN